MISCAVSISNVYASPYGIWSVWRNCGWLEQFVLILLGGLIIYSLVAAILTVLRIRSLRASGLPLNADVASALKAIQRHWNHIREATEATFYLFGLVLFLVLQYVGAIVGMEVLAGQRDKC
jgi:hypothetical protein